MKIKSQQDFWSGLMFIAVGVGFALGARDYSFGSSARPGPAYFPFGLGVLLAILGGVITFKALTIASPGGEKVGAFAWRPLLCIVGSVALFGFMLPRFGLFVSLPVLIVLCSFAGDEFSWVAVLVSAVVLTAFCWFVFSWGLGLTIPLLPSFGSAT